MADEHAQLVIAPTAVGHDRLRQQLSEFGPLAQEPTKRASDVYDGLATALELSRNSERVTVYTLVDSLAPEEMQIFASLASLPNVKSVAVSQAAQQHKLAEAQSLGAEVAIAITSERMPAEQSESVQADLPSGDIAPTQDTCAPEPEKRPARSIIKEIPASGKPRLSKEEVDALLG